MRNLVNPCLYSNPQLPQVWEGGCLRVSETPANIPRTSATMIGDVALHIGRAYRTRGFHALSIHPGEPGRISPLQLLPHSGVPERSLAAVREIPLSEATAASKLEVRKHPSRVSSMPVWQPIARLLGAILQHLEVVFLVHPRLL